MSNERLSIRTSDKDRDNVAAQLSLHYSEGRLDFAEYQQRLDEAYSSKTFQDLDFSLRQLPALYSYSSQSLPQRTKIKRHWLIFPHILLYVLVISFLMVIWSLTSPGGYFWPVWPALGWGIGISTYALKAANENNQIRARNRK